MRSMVEARRDGRLGERETASLERHLATCAACRAYAERLARYAEQVRAPKGPSVSPLDHQRRRLALLRAATFSAAPAARRTVVLAAALAAAASAGGAALLLARAAHRPAIAAVARVGPVLRRLPPRRETVVRAVPEARFERASAGGTERVDLHEGRVDLDVRPLLADERFLVFTADAEVEVRGTVFGVEAHDGCLARVEVREGRVVVRHLGHATFVSAGEAWSPALAESVGPASRPSSHATSARTAAPTTGPAAVRAEVPSASPTFADGMRAIERGDYAHAARALDDFRNAEPSDARAEDAAYLVILAHHRAGKHEEAAAAARRFLSSYPQSPRRRAVESQVGRLRSSPP
jgi:hypothetical protein